MFWKDFLIDFTICFCVSLDLASLLQKPVGGGREPPSSSSAGLVFTNSHHHQQPPPSRTTTSSTSYAHAALVKIFYPFPLNVFAHLSYSPDIQKQRLMIPLSSMPVIGSGCWFWGLGPGQEDSAQRWSSDTGTAERTWLGSTALIPGRTTCQHPRKQHLHWATARSGSTCASTLLVQLGHEGFRVQQHVAVFTVQP